VQLVVLTGMQAGGKSTFYRERFIDVGPWPGD
jgi:predicted kinase